MWWLRNDRVLPRLPAFLAMFWLAGCAQTVRIEVSLESTTVTVPVEIVEQYKNSPLPKEQWIEVHRVQSVPAFRSGTSIKKVRTELIDRNLLIVREWPGYMVVRGGIPLVNTFALGRPHYLYGFEDDKLVLGPSLFDHVASEWVAEGLTPERLETLQLFASIDVDDAYLYNNFAWLLATHPDPDLRNGKLAIEFAQRAISSQELPDWMPLDTLAAAYAAAGDFDNAVKQQRHAIALNESADEGALRRLQLYRDGRIYVSSLSELTFAETDFEQEEPVRRADLLLAAAAGSLDAQWTLATFYLYNDIEVDDGMKAPGVFWLMQAAQNGHPLAPNEIGNCFRTAGCGVEQDLDEAVRWYRSGIELDDAMAAYNLGLMTAYGEGTGHDDDEATRLLTLAANGGINAAAFLLASRYGEGLGGPPDVAAQEKFLQQIESANYGAADYLLDDAYFYTFPGVTTFAAALDRAAVPHGEAAEAIMRMADALEDAYGSDSETLAVAFTSDWTFAYAAEYVPYIVMNLVRNAAALGSTRAQLRLADYFVHGDLVPVLPEEERYWRERAAQQGGR